MKTILGKHIYETKFTHAIAQKQGIHFGITKKHIQKIEKSVSHDGVSSFYIFTVSDDFMQEGITFTDESMVDIMINAQGNERRLVWQRA